MEKLPKIIKDERGYLRIIVSEPTILKDSELTIVNNIGHKGVAIVTCTFEADLSEYNTDDVDYLKNKIKELQELADHRLRMMKLDEKKIEDLKQKPWYKKNILK